MMRHGFQKMIHAQSFSVSIFFVLAVVFVLAPNDVRAAARTSLSIPANNLGLVGHWTFDGKDMQGGMAWDRSGQNNHASLVNMPTSTTRVAGKMGQALYFPGVENNRVRLFNTSTYAGMSAITVSAWVKFTSSKCTGLNSGNVASKSNYSSQREFRLRCQQTNFAWSLSVDGTATVESFIPTSNIPVNEWVHLVGTWSGVSDSQSLYLNGALFDSDAHVGDTLFSGTANFMIGGPSDNGGSFDDDFLGAVDDVRIYNRALSATEVSQLYRQGSARLNPVTASNPTVVTYVNRAVNGQTAAASSLAFPAQNHTAGNFLIVWVKWEGVTGAGVTASVSDTAGNVYTPLAQRDFAFDDGHGQFFYAKNIRGHGTNVVTVTFTGGSPTFRNGGVFQYSGVDKVNPFIAENYTWSGGANTTSLSSGSIDLSGAGIAFGGAGEYSSAGEYFPGPGWTERFDGPIDLGIGGTAFEDRNFSAPGSLTATMSQGVAGSWIMSIAAFKKAGLQPITAAVTPSFKGSGLGQGLIGHWTFDGPDMRGGTVWDRSGQGNHGDMENMATATMFARGKIGQALNFDGINDYVAVPEDSLVGVTAFTISAWIYPRSRSDFDGIVTSRGTESLIFSLSGSSAGTDDLQLWSEEGQECVTGNQNVITNNTWQHVVVSYDGIAGSCSIYVNGINYQQGVPSTHGGFDLDDDIKIGQDDAGDRWFDGSIDDVRIYNRALSAQEVQQLYSLGR